MSQHPNLQKAIAVLLEQHWRLVAETDSEALLERTDETIETGVRGFLGGGAWAPTSALAKPPYALLRVGLFGVVSNTALTKPIRLPSAN